MARPMRAKATWSVIILPTLQGGLGIINPVCESRALLGKLVVRGLMLGCEPWKQLMLLRTHERTTTRASRPLDCYVPSLNYVSCS